MAVNKIDLNNLDKSNWQTYRFDEIAQNISERVDPNNTDLEVYIGLEHIDSESLHIKRFGTPDDVNGQKLKFYKGDIIFGRRRAYQRKAGIATCDGFCSAHSLVLRANPDVIDPELFPFFMHSDLFMNRAVDISVGSLSPTINWGTLKHQEFLIPPKYQHASIAELLWASDGNVECNRDLKNKLNQILETEIESKIHGEKLIGFTIDEVLKNLERRVNITNLKSLGRVFKGKGIPKSDVIEGGIHCVRYGELYTKHHRVIRCFYSSISNECASKAVKLEKNDILFAGSGETITEIGKSAAFVGDEIAYAGSDILIFRPAEMDGIYLGYLMNSQLVRQQLNKLGTGATVMHVYASDIEKIKAPERSITEQIEIGRYLENINGNIFQLDEKIKNSKSLQNKLMNQVF
ncbi:MAG: restriction endonuclease subunit S [Thalassolituus sp.]|jgi:restriction endonuclease S subunit